MHEQWDFVLILVGRVGGEDLVLRELDRAGVPRADFHTEEELRDLNREAFEKDPESPRPYVGVQREMPGD